MKFLIGLLVIELYCRWKLKKNVNCSYMRACTTFLIASTECPSKLRKRLLWMENTTPNRKKTSFYLTYQFALCWTLLISVSSTPAATHCSKSNIFRLRCQQHFITLKHNIVVSRHFRIHLLSPSDIDAKTTTWHLLAQEKILHYTASKFTLYSTSFSLFLWQHLYCGYVPNCVCILTSSAGFVGFNCL